MRAANGTAVVAALACVSLAACGSSALQYTPGSTTTHTSSSTSVSGLVQAPPAPYLALGDSVAFGYLANPPTPPAGGSAYKNAANFVGYPTYVGNFLDLNTTNASCPGETSGSFIDVKAADNGCRVYRSSYPLHVSYPGQSQLQYAVAFLKAHPTTELVTIGTGANDGLLVIEQCGGLANTACINSKIGPALTSLSANLTTIVQDIRGAGFNGTLDLVNFYSLNYANTNETQLVQQLDNAIATVATANHLGLADAFTAFQAAANRVGGNTCTTGLLAPGSSALGNCDLHPSLTGQQLLATTVENVAVKS
jgi:lysophospholipase L1-like esterase